MDIEIKKSKKLVNYKSAINILEKRVQNLARNNGKELIWFLEHKPIFTAGTSYKETEILEKSIKILKTNRGGKITWHGPGQIICYMVINLNNRKKDIRKFISALENSILQFLNIYKIKAKSDKKNIGIWVKGKKIAAIGLRVSRWIVFHGCSININNNLKQYLNIAPCGLDNELVTSIYNEKKIRLQNYEKKIADIFIENIDKI